jgi:6-phosphogluconolactonase
MRGLVNVYADKHALAKAFTRWFVSYARATVDAQGEFCVVLSGGSTPKAVFQRLTAETLPWERVHVFWGDERWVPHNHAESNYGQAKAVLLDQVNIPLKNVHPVPYLDAPAASAQAYAAEIAQVMQDKPFDLVLLGMGDDGHTASLFPGQETQWEGSVVVTMADYQGRPTQRVTMTPNLLNCAREKVFLISGASKAQALYYALRMNHADVALNPTHAIERARWMLDTEAATKLYK